MTDRYAAWLAVLAARDLATAQLAVLALAFVLGCLTLADNIHPRLAAFIGLAAVVAYYVTLALLASGDLARWFGR